MEPEKTSNAGQGLGIAALILGIFSLIVAFIPCFGLFALIPGIIGIILSAVALAQANKAGALKGLIIAALVVSILGTTVALVWTAILGKFINEKTEFFKNSQKIETTVDNDSSASVSNDTKDLESILENLEKSDSSQQSITTKDFDKLINEYEVLMQDYIKYAKKSKDGDVNSLSKVTELSVKSMDIATRIAKASSKLTETQKNRFEAIQKKYDVQIQKINH
jgi:phosphate/sulfate permease